MKNEVRVGKSVTEKLIHVESVDTLYYFEFSDNFKDHLEEHAAWEMIYADKGHCTVIADEETFTLEQGELYFHSPFERHMLKIGKNEYPNIIVSSFQCSSPAMQFFKRRKIEASLQIKQSIATIIHEASLTFDHSRKVRVGTSAGKPQRPLWAGEQTVLLRFELMLIDLIRENAPTEEPSRPFVSRELADDALSVKIIDFLEENLYGKLDMDALCRRLNFSASYLARHFSKTCGYSINRYYNRMKIEEAKRLIRQTHMSFFEISEKLMLTNAHYFSTLFKNYVGMTPTQYKKSCK